MPPSITNNNRERLRIRRSGQFVPHIWAPGVKLIVSDYVKQRLSHLHNIEFLQIEFERLVDVPLPELGDFSWFDRVTYPPGPDPDYELDKKPDLPRLHQSIGRYWEILCANLFELDPEPADAESVIFNFGSYSGAQPEDALVSVSLLQQYPFVWSSGVQVREDAFAILAPLLDLDYFDIARHYIDTDDDLDEEDESDEDGEDA